MIITEIVQAGDVFLIHFNCPKCEGANFHAFPPDNCFDCKEELKNLGYKVPATRSGTRLLAGTKRIRIQFYKKTIRRLIEMQNNECAYCDQPLAQFHIEHITPLSVGGTNNASNLCLACPPCNLKAGSLCFRTFWDKKIYLMQKFKNKLIAGTNND